MASLLASSSRRLAILSNGISESPGSAAERFNACVVIRAVDACSCGEDTFNNGSLPTSEIVDAHNELVESVQI